MRLFRYLSTIALLLASFACAKDSARNSVWVAVKNATDQDLRDFSLDAGDSSLKIQIFGPNYTYARWVRLKDPQTFTISYTDASGKHTPDGGAPISPALIGGRVVLTLNADGSVGRLDEPYSGPPITLVTILHDYRGWFAFCLGLLGLGFLIIKVHKALSARKNADQWPYVKEPKVAIVAPPKAKEPAKKSSNSHLWPWIIATALFWLTLLGGGAYFVFRLPQAFKSINVQFGARTLTTPEQFEASFGNSTTLPEPDSIALDSSGALWVMGGPHINKYLKIIRPDGSIVFAAGENGPVEFGFVGPIVVDPRGFLYHSDIGFHTVRKLDQTGARLATVLGPSQEGLTGTAHGPAGLALDEGGNLYVAEIFNHRVQKLGPDGEYVTHWGHPLTETATAWEPFTLAAGRGRVYAGSQNDRTIHIFDSVGNSLATWTGTEDSRVNGFSHVRQIALRPDGRVLIADTDRVLEFSEERVLLGIWQGGEKAGWYAHGVAAADGRVYILDQTNNRILVTRNPPTLDATK